MLVYRPADHGLRPAQRGHAGLRPGLSEGLQNHIHRLCISEGSPVAGGAILNQERSTICGCDLQPEAFEVLIPPEDVTVGGAGEGVNGALCKPADWHVARTHAGYLGSK